jgi:hypothetical protein
MSHQTDQPISHATREPMVNQMTSPSINETFAAKNYHLRNRLVIYSQQFAKHKEEALRLQAELEEMEK